MNAKQHSSFVAFSSSDDTIASLGLSGYASALRAGSVSASSTTSYYLDRIKTLNPHLNAFNFIDFEGAKQAAETIDRFVSEGVDLGPLMGVPVVVKDIFAVQGTETTAGSHLDVTDLIGAEGTFIRTLRRMGCIFLGKTKTTEFAFTPSGINRSKGTPRNPHDSSIARIPGGSSSGSAVALGAGMCGLAIGSDTGGSVRVPAALNGIVGFKPTAGIWPLDGVFSLSSTLDTIGFFSRTVADAAFVFTALQGGNLIAADSARLNIAIPNEHFFENIDSAVGSGFSQACHALSAAGVRLPKVYVPEAAERAPMLAQIMAAELIATLGKRRLIEKIDLLDLAVRTRIEANLGMSAHHYVGLLRRQRYLEGEMKNRMRGLNGWLMPTVPCVAPALSAVSDLTAEMDLNVRLTQNTQPANLFGQCAISIPLGEEHQLPVGLQIIGMPGDERALLETALAVEALLKRQHVLI